MPVKSCGFWLSVMDFHWIPPFKDLPNSVVQIILYGDEGEEFEISYEGRFGPRNYTMKYEGLIPTMQRRYEETPESMRGEYEAFMTHTACPVCHGSRLKPEALGSNGRRYQYCCLNQYVYS